MVALRVVASLVPGCRIEVPKKDAQDSDSVSVEIQLLGNDEERRVSGTPPRGAPQGNRQGNTIAL